MKLVVTIDTEEDNWGSLRLTHYSFDNIARIPALQEMFDRFNVKPTYLMTYPVATDEKAVGILAEIAAADRCEIGAHCHPWNTPPLAEENTAANSMLCNLSSASQYAKMKSLKETIEAAVAVDPLSFRSGRFGYDTGVARNLQRLGYKIDTSISPYMNWTSDHGPDFTRISPRPFRFSSDDALEECATGELIEVPPTIGFLQRDFARRNYIFNAVTRGPISRLRLAWLLGQARLLNKAWLSPEVSDSRTMIELAQSMRRHGYGLLNLTFHSPSLKAGLTPFTTTKSDEKLFCQHLREFLVFAQDTGIEVIKLSDVQKLF